MDIIQKKEELRKLGTKDLIEKIEKLEDKLEGAMRDDASFRNLNAEYIATYNSDCRRVDEILADLSLKIPEMIPGTEKKMTNPDREAWLKRQRKDNRDLSHAIDRQNSITFELDNNRITIESTKKRLESAKAVLALRTAQIEFLRGS